MTDQAADLIIVARTVHTLAGDAPPVTMLAVRDGKIAATAGPGDRGELTAAWRGPGTVIIDEPGLVVLPAFVDTHNHLMLAGQNILGVPVSQAGDIPRLVGADRRARRADPAGAVDPQRRGLARARPRRAPAAHRRRTRPGHHRAPGARPARRAQRRAQLRRAAAGRHRPGHPGHRGRLHRQGRRGEPRGWLQDAALDVALRAVPPLPEPALRDGLAQASAQYAAHGLGTVRDPAVSPGQWQAYLRAQAAGQLSVRGHAMIFTTAPAIAAAGSMDAYLDGLEEQGITPGAGDGLLRLWGLKFVLDGGVEAAALEQPYADRPGYRGELLWDRDDADHRVHRVPAARLAGRRARHGRPRQRAAARRHERRGRARPARYRRGCW